MLGAIVLRKLAEGRPSLSWSGIDASADLLITAAALGLTTWIIGTMRKRRARA